jgi:hypothetical protein
MEEKLKLAITTVMMMKDTLKMVKRNEYIFIFINSIILINIKLIIKSKFSNFKRSQLKEKENILT